MTDRRKSTDRASPRTGKGGRGPVRINPRAVGLGIALGLLLAVSLFLTSPSLTRAAPQPGAALQPGLADVSGGRDTLVAPGRDSLETPADSAAAASLPDSIALENGLRVRGPLSTGEVKRALGAERLSAEEARARLARLGNALVEEGFFEAEIVLTSPPASSGPGAPAGRGGKAEVDIRPGSRAEWDRVQVRIRAGEESSAVAPPTGLPHPRGTDGGLPNPQGRFRAADCERLLREWVGTWAEAGYPFARASVESLAVGQGRVGLRVGFDPGPQCAVSAVEFPGRTSTGEGFLLRWIRFRPGRLYRESEWEARRRRLEQSGLFVRVDPPEPVLMKDGTVRVRLPVEEGKHNRLEAAAGYAGGTNTLSFFADLELGDLFGSGRYFRARYDRLRQDARRFQLQATEPLLPVLPVGFRGSLENEEQDSTLSLTTWEGTLEGRIGFDLTAFIGLEYRRSLVGVEPSEVTRRLSRVAGGRWDNRSPTRWRGGLLEASFRTGTSRIREPSGETRRLSLEREGATAERFWPLGDVVLLHTEIRAEAISRNDTLPLGEAMRIGGTSTIRGYAEEEFPTRRYGVGRIELGPAWPEGRAYLFVDAGWFRRIEALRGTEEAAGFGLAFSSRSVSRIVSLDLGVPRGGGLADARLHLRIETRF